MVSANLDLRSKSGNFGSSLKYFLVPITLISKTFKLAHINIEDVPTALTFLITLDPRSIPLYRIPRTFK
jgi:hypothetical protein